MRQHTQASKCDASLLGQALQSGGRQALMKAIEWQIKRDYPVRLFTLTCIDQCLNLAFRLYSSNPAAYSVGGTKPIEKNAWTSQVIDNKEAFVANDMGTLATVFFDHQLIESLGLGSVINWPVVVNNQVVGTVNILDKENAYQNMSHEGLERLYPWLALVFGEPSLG